ncbi:thioredoxin-dependent thiol peroxidase [Planococcus lenghuensis]|uniref:thioredoxin-dependent peroxiredoxin n=1 Tax=Planococcus lenghuensis TaxID=2213202 RepID=A0A1Q2KWK4_9BACL|nr:thioredoxin-dependent thiol peroxidase [Planococcus lenghuensis]AQQ52506.1 thioredoxin-dependent thiol peroxidase [Planococcus lenghuensis]
MTNLEKQQAPDFNLANEKGEQISLKDFAGEKYVVLYFYPKDMTPGCTTEACDFRDAAEDFSQLDAVILGVSPDEAEDHTRFIEKHGLPFSLLVDSNHRVSEDYGVWVEKNRDGQKYMGIERSTFLIDLQGTIIREWRKVNVENHIREVLETLRTVQEQ